MPGAFGESFPGYRVNGNRDRSRHMKTSALSIYLKYS
jgi:hypothetical protein